MSAPLPVDFTVEPDAQNPDRIVWGVPLFDVARAALVPLCIGLALALPSVVPLYGRMDDYPQLLQALEGGLGSFVQYGASFGRPTTFVSNGSLYRLAGGVEGLWILRAIAALAFASAAGILSATAVLLGSRLRVATTLGLLVLALPGTWVMVTWAQGAGHGISFLAAILAASAYALWGANPQLKWRLGVLSAATVLTIIAMFGYQLYALAVPALTCALLLLGNRFRSGRNTALFAVTATALAFGANVLLVSSSANITQAARTSIVTDISGKFWWVLGELLPRLLWPFSPTPQIIPAVAVGLVAIALLAVVIARHRSPKASRVSVDLALFAITVVLPVAPLIAMQENWASSRAVLAGALVIWAYLLVALVVLQHAPTASGVANGGRRQQVLSLASSLLSAIVLVSTIYWATTAYRLLALPSSREWTQVVSIWSAPTGGVSEATILAEPFMSENVGTASYDEFAILTGSVSWAAPTMHLFAARESGIWLDIAQIAFDKSLGTCQGPPLVSAKKSSILINPVRAWGCPN